MSYRHSRTAEEAYLRSTFLLVLELYVDNRTADELERQVLEIYRELEPAYIIAGLPAYVADAEGTVYPACELIKDWKSIRFDPKAKRR